MHITMDNAVDWLANYILNGENITPAKRAEILPVKKYNLLVTGFNISTALLVTCVAAAILFNSVASVTFLAIGLFMRWTTEEELNSYTLPIADKQKTWGDRFVDLVRDNKEKEEHVFKRVGRERQEGWEIDVHSIFKYAAWKNQIKV